MKRNISILFIVLLVLCHCAKDNSNTETQSRHIQYFGFSLIDTFWDDPTDDPLHITNYIDEVSSFTNIADILVVNPTDIIIDRLNMMNTQGVKAFIHLNAIFFEQNGTNAPSGTNYNLRSDYEARWDTFVSTNNLQNNTNQIQAMYLGEEPTWNGISFTELNAASNYIKSTLSEIPILIIEAFPALNNLEIPQSVDWVGFDHYFIKDPKNDSNFIAELELLKSKLTRTNQKIVFIMDTHYIQSIHGDLANIDINDMKDVANSYYELALNEPKTIALIGYFWPSGFDNTNAIGARHMPEAVKNEYERIGLEIIQE